MNLFENVKENVLFLGEGNFSFSANVVRNLQKCDWNFSCFNATCYEGVEGSEIKEKNISFLKSQNVQVVYNANATELHTDIRLNKNLFDKIIFMFPHTGGKMKIHKNRELLFNTFSSARKMLKIGGSVIITLCKGQGGTPFDPEQRRVEDTWRILHSAQDNDLALTNIFKFPADEFQDYSQVGYRSLQKGFDIQDSVVHVFTLLPTPDFNPLLDLTYLGLSNTHSPNESSSETGCITVQLYPLTHTHHVSFWTHKPVSIEQIQEVADTLSAGLVRSIVELERFTPNATEQRLSQTLELTYSAQQFPLGPKKCFEFHGVLGKSLANLYSVQLR